MAADRRDSAALLELEGALFFGTADALRGRLQQLAPRADTVILDLRQVSEIDVTAARILHEMAEDWAQMGKPLVFAEWPAHDTRRHVLEAVATDPDAALLRFEDHADRALELAEKIVRNSKQKLMKFLISHTTEIYNANCGLNLNRKLIERSLNLRHKKRRAQNSPLFF